MDTARLYLRLRTIINVVVWMCILLFAASGANGSSKDPYPNLSGSWKLNAELSDDPQEVIRETMMQMREERRNRMRMQGDRRRAPDAPGRGGFARGGERPGQMPDNMRNLEKDMQILRIVQEDSKILITNSVKRTLTLYADGRALRQETSQGEIIRKAFWNKEGLVTQSDLPNRAKIIRTYRLIEDGSRLHVVTRIEPERFPRKIEFESVYDASPEKSHQE
jgi:hypothetical protein